MTDIERQTIAKVTWRIVPLMAVALLLNYLDRVNIGFAALTMNEDLTLSNTQFGVAAGAFAIGYVLFGIPSTLILHRLGARRWISLIMIVWGLCSMSTAFVSTPQELMLVRLLLGAAEAGFFPGIIYYFSCWFPNAYMGRVLGAFLAIGPLGFVIGGPLSSFLLSWDGVLGLQGWQWLFIVEALPTLALAPLVFILLTDAPATARWLTDHQRRWLSEHLAQQRRQLETADAAASFWHTVADTRVWLLALIYLAMGTAGMGAVYFLPLVIRSMGFSTADAGLLAALPAAIAALCLPLWGMGTDRAAAREMLVAAACGSMTLGLIGGAMLLPSAWALAALCMVMIGFYGFVAPFWTLPSAFLAGRRAALGIAFINVVGNLASFFGPALLGSIADASGSYGRGLGFLSVFAAAAMLLMCVLWRTQRARVRSHEVPSAG